MNDKIKELKRLYKNANAEDKEYAELLVQWLNDWLTPKPTGPTPQDDPGDHPPPPPPHK